jgi:hypothetical protein
MRLKLRQIYLDDLIIFATLVLLKVVDVTLGEISDVLTLGGVEVVAHYRVSNWFVQESSLSTYFGSYKGRAR